MTLVLEGEQHVTEIREDGSRETVVRRQGDYALASTDALPHLERGGPEGGTLLLSMQAPDGRLFEYFDRDMKSVRVLTIEEYVESWNEGTAYGASEAEVA